MRNEHKIITIGGLVVWLRRINSFCIAPHCRRCLILLLLFNAERRECPTNRSHHFGMRDTRQFEIFVLFLDEFCKSAGRTHRCLYNFAVFLFLVQENTDRSMAVRTSNVFHFFRFCVCIRSAEKWNWTWGKFMVKCRLCYVYSLAVADVALIRVFVFDFIVVAAGDDRQFGKYFIASRCPFLPFCAVAAVFTIE